MYSETDRRSSVRRANDEFLRRMLGGEAAEGTPFCAVMNMNGGERPQLPPEGNRPSCDGSYRPGEGGDACPKHIHAPALAMAYAPRQCWQNLLDPASGLKAGSMFAELILPFEAAKCHKETEVRPCK